MRIFLLPLVLWLLPAASFGQTQPKPKFYAFEGVVYELAKEQLPLGYGDHVMQRPILDSITLKKLWIPNANLYDRPFPGIELRNRFGIVFTSGVKIPVDGEYGFTLNSDDGSILWINGIRVVDNDKPHKMTKRGGKITLAAGTYPVKVWYYQAYPPLYGIELQGEYLGPAPDAAAIHEALVFDETQLQFAYNSAALPDSVDQVFGPLLAQLNQLDSARVEVIGHCDESGTPAYNLRLSLARANAVKGYLTGNVTQRKIKIIAEGKGAEMPIADNKTAAGRQRNRRVEIRIVDFR